MYRCLMEKLYAWKASTDRKPLILRGARQVGKTWLLKEFGRLAYKDVHYLNFDTDPALANVFGGDIRPGTILSRLEVLVGQKIRPQETLLVFDEVQEVPRALTSLKYFNEDAPEYHIVAAGSLLGVALHPGTSFPVGKVSFLDLYPLSFREFLLATGNDALVAPIQNGDFDTLRVLKTKYGELLKQYLILGGMPKVLFDFLENADYKRAGVLQQEILDAYDQDISKHAPPIHVPRIRWLWSSIPRQLSKENKKFIYGQVKEGARGRDYELALLWLSDCGLVHRVNRVAEVEYPLKAYEDWNAFKLFLCDVGLLSRMAGLDERILISGNDIFNEFKGALTEQYVLGELICETDFTPFYWSSEKGRAEIDFLIQSGLKIVPIEAKAGINLQAKSLKVFMGKYHTETAVRTSLADHKRNAVFHDGESEETMAAKTATTAEIIDIPLYGFGALSTILP